MSRGDPKYLRLLDRMRDLHIAKAAGYSGDDSDTWTNFREASKWGVTPMRGVLVRLGDKYRRLQNIVTNPANDLLEDEDDIATAMDLAAYALIYVCLREEVNLVRAGSTPSDPPGVSRQGEAWQLPSTTCSSD